MEIDYDKLAAAILQQQRQPQPSVVPDAAILNPSEQERGASSSNTQSQHLIPFLDEEKCP